MFPSKQQLTENMSTLFQEITKNTNEEVNIRLKKLEQERINLRKLFNEHRKEYIKSEIKNIEDEIRRVHKENPTKKSVTVCLSSLIQYDHYIDAGAILEIASHFIDQGFLLLQSKKESGIYYPFDVAYENTPKRMRLTMKIIHISWRNDF